MVIQNVYKICTLLSNFFKNMTTAALIINTHVIPLIRVYLTIIQQHDNHVNFTLKTIGENFTSDNQRQFFYREMCLWRVFRVCCLKR